MTCSAASGTALRGAGGARRGRRGRRGRRAGSPGLAPTQLPPPTQSRPQRRGRQRQHHPRQSLPSHTPAPARPPAPRTPPVGPSQAAAAPPAAMGCHASKVAPEAPYKSVVITGERWLRSLSLARELGPPPPADGELGPLARCRRQLGHRRGAGAALRGARRAAGAHGAQPGAAGDGGAGLPQEGRRGGPSPPPLLPPPLLAATAPVVPSGMGLTRRRSPRRRCCFPPWTWVTRPPCAHSSPRCAQQLPFTLCRRRLQPFGSSSQQPHRSPARPAFQRHERLCGRRWRRRGRWSWWWPTPASCARTSRCRAPWSRCAGPTSQVRRAEAAPLLRSRAGCLQLPTSNGRPCNARPARRRAQHGGAGAGGDGGGQAARAAGADELGVCHGPHCCGVCRCGLPAHLRGPGRPRLARRRCAAGPGADGGRGCGRRAQASCSWG